MPRKRHFTNYKRRPRRRYYARKYVPRRQLATTRGVFKQSSAFGDRYYAKMKFATVYRAGTSSGSYNNYHHRANNAYDPDYSVGGTQPYGYDQLTAIYDRVHVIGCAWKVLCVNCDTDTAPYVAIMTSVNANTPNTIKNLVEDDRCQWRQMSYSNGAKNMVILKGYCDCAKVFGITRQAYLGDTAYSHPWNAVQSDASKICYHTFTIFNNDSTATDVQVTFDFTYYLVFSERKAYTPS
jgi:hypothetical protein